MPITDAPTVRSFQGGLPQNGQKRANLAPNILLGSAFSTEQASNCDHDRSTQYDNPRKQSDAENQVTANPARKGLRGVLADPHEAAHKRLPGAKFSGGGRPV
jgi:hypothetical protein